MLLHITPKSHTIAAVAIAVNMVTTTLAGTMLMHMHTIPQQQHFTIHTQEVHSTTRIQELSSITQHTLEARLERQLAEMLGPLEVLEVMANRAAW